MFIAVTGASGYIGRHLAPLASKRGHEVLFATRQTSSVATHKWVHFDLSSPLSIKFPTDIDAIIHLAASNRPLDCKNENCEVVIAKELLKFSQEVGAKFIFVSSQVASPEAPSSYGKNKWEIEQLVIAARGCVVRPGLVYGGYSLGLFGMLVKIVKTFPILPAFKPEPLVQPIHVNDLAEGLLRIAERDGLQGNIISLAAPQGIRFSKFLNEIALTRLHRFRIFIPVPVLGVNFLLKIIGESMRSIIKADRLKSLFVLPVMETDHDLNELKLVLRPLRSGMTSVGNNQRKKLLLEGRSLIKYIVKIPPSNYVLRRYVKSMELMREGKCIGLSKIFIFFPMLLALIDDSSKKDNLIIEEFFWRLDAATLIVEATPLGAHYFLCLDRKKNIIICFISIAIIIGKEFFWRVARLMMSSIMLSILSRKKNLSES